MAEVFVRFETVVIDPHGSRWVPRVCGREQTGGLWEGWIEFEPVDGSGRSVHTPHESIQPNRNDLMYWAQGLTQTYLEGALRRALSPTRTPEAHAIAALLLNESAAVNASEAAAPIPVLNPFDVYHQGEDVLVRQLAALSMSRLREIAIGYGFASRQAADAATAEILVSKIVDGVRPSGR